MSSNVSSASSIASTSGRTADVPNLQRLKSPEEGGNKKDYEDFLDKIASFVTITWTGGSDVGSVLRSGELPDISPPIDLTDDELKSKLKVRQWERKADLHTDRVVTLDNNKTALFALLYDNITKILRAKLKSKHGYAVAESTSDVVWLLQALEDIMSSFEEVIPNVLSLDDQLERIIKLRQGSASNEDFIKIVQKEVKIFEKHGGALLWGQKQEEQLKAQITDIINENSKETVIYTEEEIKEKRRLIKKSIQDEILAMVIIKRADKRRFGNLQIELKNSFLLGKNDYPTTVPEALKILNNYKPVWSTNARHGDTNNSARNVPNQVNSGVTFLQAQGSSFNIEYLRGSNGSFFSNVTCRLCGLKGHYQSNCPVVTNANGHRLHRNGDGDTGGTPANGQSQTNGSGDGGGEVRHQRLGFQMNQHRQRQRNSNSTSLNPMWILLDSESTDHFFFNRDLLRNITVAPDGEVLRMHSSGGYIDTNQRGMFGDLPIWYHPHALGNVLSLARLGKQYTVEFNTRIENAFIVYLTPTTTLKFVCRDPGLYVYDATHVDLQTLHHAFQFLTTVAENKSFFQDREIRKADAAILLNRRLNHMAPDKFIRAVHHNWIHNNPLTVGDIRRSHAIYGPPIPPLKGRTRYRTPPRIPDATDVIQIPSSIHEAIRQVTLCVDFHFVNGLAVLHTISRNINYRTVTFPKTKTTTSIMRELHRVFRLYRNRGFDIIEVHADLEFEPCRTHLHPIRLVTVGKDEHVPEIERSVQTSKHENRSICHAMPYKCIPLLMLRELIRMSNTMLNAFGNYESVTRGLSPRNIIDNLPHLDYNHLKYEFGQYVQLHVTRKITNTMHSRTIGAIVLGPCNIRGTYHYMSLETGKLISGRVVAVLPLTQDVITRVEHFGLAQDQPYRESKMLQYEWSPGVPVHDDDLHVNLPPPGIVPLRPDFPDPYFDPPRERALPGDQGAMRGNGDQRQQVAQITEQNQGAENQGARNQGPENQGADDIGDIKDEHDEEISIDADDEDLIREGNYMDRIYDSDDESIDDHEDINRSEEFLEILKDDSEPEGQIVFVDEEEVDNDSQHDSEVSSDAGSESETREKERQARSAYLRTPSEEEYGRGKRQKELKSYTFLQKCHLRAKRSTKKTKGSFSFLQKNYEGLTKQQQKEYFKRAWGNYLATGRTNDIEQFTTGFVFAQMTAKQGIKKYGREAELKLLAEFKQLVEYKTFHGRRAEELTPEQKKKAANMINLIEEKLNRGHTPENPVIKGRSCYNGSIQRGLYTKEDTASPTVSVDAFFLTGMIDAKEGRDTAITDIKGAYLNAKMKDEVLMKITGREAELFCEIDPNLEEFIVEVKGQKVLYVQLDKALYGCVQSALLWYELYSSTLQEMGFELNPYDLCVANAQIEGSQCTICWYVDDNKISHKNPKVVDDVIKRIESKFGKMSQTRGNDHEFLGMSIKYKGNNLEISMKKHIKKAIDMFKEDIVQDAATPAASYLFDQRESPQLSEEDADNFHSVVASLLYISRRCRLDIQTAVGYLCTRVSKPTEDDWIKLKRVLRYLRGTLDLTLTIGADDICKSKAWVDVSYGVHNDCKSHTGGAISWGRGVLLTKCQKQKLNVKSSTEGEIVGVSDFLPNMIWSRMFLEEQGYRLTDNVLYQDNQSAMKIILNGKKSSGQKTKHMDNRYFWIKDRLKNEEIQVIYCPTAKMVADFFTKPLQGNLFRKLRDIILGYKHISELYTEDEESPVEERVRNGDKEEFTEEKTEKEKTVTTEDSPVVTSTDSTSVGKQGNSEHEKVILWKDIVIGKTKQKSEKPLILLKQSK